MQPQGKTPDPANHLNGMYFGTGDVVQKTQEQKPPWYKMTGRTLSARGSHEGLHVHTEQGLKRPVAQGMRHPP